MDTNQKKTGKKYKSYSPEFLFDFELDDGVKFFKGSPVHENEEVKDLLMYQNFLENYNEKAIDFWKIKEEGEKIKDIHYSINDANESIQSKKDIKSKSL